MSKLLQKVKEEIRALVPPTAFFLVALFLIGLIRVLMLSGTGVSSTAPLQIAVGALILGKAVLVADMLPFINRYPDKPLVYNVAWKTAIYTLLATLIHYVERLVEFWREAGGFMAANETLLAHMMWRHFWAIEIIAAILIFNYCTATELVRVLGANRVRQMLFGSSTKAGG